MVTLSIIFAVVFVTTIAHAMYLGRKARHEEITCCQFTDTNRKHKKNAPASLPCGHSKKQKKG